MEDMGNYGYTLFRTIPNAAEDEDFAPSSIVGGGHRAAEDEDFAPSAQGWGGHTSAQDENW